MDRRDFLAGVAALTLGARPGMALESPARKRALRVAFVNDVHIQPELRAGEGFAACLKHLQSQNSKPELILFGGDTVMDANDVDRARAQLQWDLWKTIYKTECGLPFEACLGNHDIWGLNKTKSGTTGSEPGHGKKMALDMIGAASAYRSFTKAGWKFIVLDNVQPGEKPGSYAGYLDTQQFEWLTKELESTPKPTPILVFGHVPIVSSIVLAQKRQTPSSDLRVQAGYVHTDAGALQDLFVKHGKVKLCLSGHLHAIDKCEVLGVTYCCMGSVSGNWWKGPHGHFPEGYSVVDLFDDGSFDVKYVKYGWKAQI